jgi:hypothetical protein
MVVGARLALSVGEGDIDGTLVGVLERNMVGGEEGHAVGASVAIGGKIPPIPSDFELPSAKTRK